MKLNHPIHQEPTNIGYGYAAVLPFLIYCCQVMYKTNNIIPQDKWKELIKILTSMLELVYEYTFKKNIDQIDEKEFLDSMQSYINDLNDKIINTPPGNAGYTFNVICNLHQGNLIRTCERLIEEMGFVGFNRELLRNRLNSLVYLNGREYEDKYLKHFDNRIIEKIAEILKKIKWDKTDVLMLFDFLRENYDIDLVKKTKDIVILDIFHGDSPYAISALNEENLARDIANNTNYREALRIWLTNNL